MMKFNNNALLELCRYFLPEDPTLEKEVQLSIKNPQSFLTQIKFILKDWIKDEPIEQEIPWYTFIHGLYQRGLIFELSARTMAESINEHYAKKSFFELQAIKEDHYPFLNTIHIVDLFLALTGKQLQTVNYMLGELRLPSGTSIITMVRQQVADQCADLVHRSGYGELILYPSSSCIHQMDHLLMKEHVCQRHEKLSSLPV